MSTTTPEPRKRTRRSKDGIRSSLVVSTANDGSDDDPDIVRLRAVLTMLAEGRTQREIAKHFGKDKRTIRRWVAAARSRQVVSLRGYNAEGELAKALYRLDEEFAFAMRTRRNAEEIDDLRLALRANEQCQRITETRLAILTKFGLFDSYRLGATGDQISHEADAALIAGAAHRVLFGTNDNASEGAVPADEESVDELI